MEIVLVISVIIVVIYIIYIVNSNQKKRDRLLALEQEENTKLFIAEFGRIGEQYEISGIPSIDSDIGLKKSETLYVKFPNIKWMEYRKKRTGVSYQGMSTKIRIAKGLYYRAGTGQMTSESIDELTPVDNGDLYFTNKGIFFRGATGNKTLPYGKIAMLIPFQQGLKIERDSGKDIYIPYTIEPGNAAAIVLLWDKERTA